MPKQQVFIMTVSSATGPKQRVIARETLEYMRDRMKMWCDFDGSKEAERMASDVEALIITFTEVLR